MTPSPFPPIFTHKEIGKQHLCPEMLTRAEELGLLKRPTKCLVSIMKQKQLTMVTALAKYVFLYIACILLQAFKSLSLDGI